MNIDAVGEEYSTFSLNDNGTEENLCWNGRSVEVVQTTIEKPVFIFRENIKLISKSKSLKPLMGTLKEGAVRAEAGYTERDGVYAKTYIEWKFGPNEENAQKEPEQTSKETGEVNSTDRN